MSHEDRGEFHVQLEMPAGTSIDEMDRVTSRAEKIVRENPEVRTLFVTVGKVPNSEEANKADIRVYTTNKRERRVTQTQIQDDLRKRLARIPALSTTIADIGMIEGFGTEQPIMLFVRSEDYAQLQTTARAVLDMVKSVRGVDGCRPLLPRRAAGDGAPRRPRPRGGFRASRRLPWG